MVNKFENGTNQLANLDGNLHDYNVNRSRLNKYVARLMTIVENDMLKSRTSMVSMLIVEEDFGPSFGP